MQQRRAAFIRRTRQARRIRDIASATAMRARAHSLKLNSESRACFVFFTGVCSFFRVITMIDDLIFFALIAIVIILMLIESRSLDKKERDRKASRDATEHRADTVRRHRRRC